MDRPGFRTRRSLARPRPVTPPQGSRPVCVGQAYVRDGKPSRQRGIQHVATPWLIRPSRSRVREPSRNWPRKPLVTVHSVSMCTAAERFDKLVAQYDGAELRTRTIHGGAVALGAQALDFVLRLASIAILARLLVPEYFGLISMVTAITSIAERFKDLGLGTATVQRSRISHDQISNLFWVNFGLGVAMTLIVGALAFPIARFYDDSRLFTITLAIASSFFWGG